MWCLNAGVAVRAEPLRRLMCGGARRRTRRYSFVCARRGKAPPRIARQSRRNHLDTPETDPDVVTKQWSGRTSGAASPPDVRRGAPPDKSLFIHLFTAG